MRSHCQVLENLAPSVPHFPSRTPSNHTSLRKKCEYNTKSGEGSAHPRGREVELATISGNLMKRPVNVLVPLELDDPEEETEDNYGEEKEASTRNRTHHNLRPKQRKLLSGEINSVNVIAVGESQENLSSSSNENDTIFSMESTTPDEVKSLLHQSPCDHMPSSTRRFFRRGSKHSIFNLELFSTSRKGRLRAIENTRRNMRPAPTSPQRRQSITHQEKQIVLSP